MFHSREYGHFCFYFSRFYTLTPDFYLEINPAQKLNIAIRLTDEGMDGYGKGEAQYYLELFSDHFPKEVSFRSIPVDFQYEDGKIVLYLEGEGSIKIQW